MAHNGEEWSLNVSIPEKYSFPSFIRLFITKRVLEKYQHTNNKNVNMSDLIELLNSSQKNVSIRSIATKILCQLLVDGIKKFMENDFEDQHSSIIENNFNQICQEYESVIKYNNDNMNDLMCLIFQFLDYDNGELFNCSLVNSHWLYHSYNPNSVYRVNLTKLIQKTLSASKQKTKNDNNDCKNRQFIISSLSTSWQHVINARDVTIELNNDDLDYDDESKNDESENDENENDENDSVHTSKRLVLGEDGHGDELLKKLCLLGNIENIKCILNEREIGILRAILPKCANKIKRYYVEVNASSNSRKFSKDNEVKWILSPLRLINANYIWYNHSYYAIEWSNKCEVLEFDAMEIDKVGIEWCQFVTDNCDCSGIKLLHFDNFSLVLDLTKISNTDKKTENNKNVEHTKNSKNSKNSTDSKNNTYDTLQNKKLNISEIKLLQLSILNKLASKFTSLKHLKMCWMIDSDDDKQGNSCELLFWQELAIQILKNNGTIEFKVPYYIGVKYYESLKKLDWSKIQLDKFEFGLDHNWATDCFEYTTMLINCPTLQWLKAYTTDFEGDGITTLVTYLDKESQRDGSEVADGDDYNGKFGSLKVIECGDFDEVYARSLLWSIYAFFCNGLIRRRKLFVIGNFFVYHTSVANDVFEEVCQELLVLVTEYNLPVNISITFETIHEEKFIQMEKVYKRYLSKNESDLMANYSHSKLCKNCKDNQFCIPLKNVTSTFSYKRDTGDCVLQIINAKIVDFDANVI